MNRKRIERTIKLMERVRDKRLPFDMHYYFDGPADDCSTAACMAGWMTRDPVLKKQGFVAGSADGGSPEFEGRVGMGAVAQFFSIEYGQAYDLVSIEAYGQSYDPCQWPTNIKPDDVIKKLQRLLEG